MTTTDVCHTRRGFLQGLEFGAAAFTTPGLSSEVEGSLSNEENVSSPSLSVSLSSAWFLATFCVPSFLAVTASAQETAVPVTVSAVVEEDVPTSQRVVGTVLPIQTSIVGSAVDGRVVKFQVNEGDAVKKGQTLAKLRTGMLEIELAAAKAEQKLRQEELNELMNGSRPEEKDQAKARMQAAKSLMEYLQKKYQRFQTLFEQGGSVSDDQIEEALSVMVIAEKAHVQEKLAYALAEKGPREERKAQARARLELQTQQVRLIEDRISRHTIVSPFDGFITAEHTEQGQWVSEGDPVAEVIRLDQVDIQTFILGTVAARLKKGDSVLVEVSALPGQVFYGRVELIVPKADVRSRTFPVKVRVENTIQAGDPLLKSGMLASLQLATGTTLRATLVLKDALVLDGSKRQVIVIDSDPKQPNRGVARSIPVELGIAHGALIQVLGAPLKKGQVVVVRGNERIQTGQLVEIIRTLPAEKVRPQVSASTRNP